MKKITYLIPFVALLLTGCDVKIDPAEGKAVMEDSLAKEEEVNHFKMHVESFQKNEMEMTSAISESESMMVSSQMDASIDLTLLDQWANPDGEQSLSYVQTTAGEALEVYGEESSTTVVAPETFAYYLKDTIGYADFTEAPVQYEEDIGGDGSDLKLKMYYDFHSLFMSTIVASPFDMIDQILEEYDLFVQKGVFNATENAGNTTVSVQLNTQIFGEISDIKDAEDNEEPLPTSFPDYSDGYVVTDGEITETTVIHRYKMLLTFDANHYLTHSLYDFDVEIGLEGSSFINGTNRITYKIEIDRTNINDENLTCDYPSDLDSYVDYVE